MKSLIAIALVVSSFALAPENAVAAGQVSPVSDTSVQKPVAKPATSIAANYIGW